MSEVSTARRRKSRWLVAFLAVAMLAGVRASGHLQAQVARAEGEANTRVSSANASVVLSKEGEMPSLDGATGWLNSRSMSAPQLRGKVVLVSFWTYSCINWRRTLPYLRAWDQKYRERGLAVIGVHSPEFEFEKDPDNVRWAIQAMKIEYPVALDSNFAVWRAFENQYWPALYFIDTHGKVRYHQFGEGEYDRAEAVIQQLLGESGHGGSNDSPVSPRADGIEAPAEWSTLGSPENYVGYERTEGFSSPGGMRHDKSANYTAPAVTELNHWAISGEWTAHRHVLVSNQPNGHIRYRFHARDLHLVMGPAMRGQHVRFRVLLDGKPPEAAHGSDIDEQGYGTVAEPRLYQLIRQQQPVRDRQVDIEFLDSGVEAYSFTFG